MTTDAIKPHVSHEKSAQLKFILNLVFYVILISGLLAGPPEEYGWINLDHPDERKALIDYAFQHILD